MFAELGHERLGWLKTYGYFDNSFSADNTIAHVVSNIDCVAFEKMFIERMLGGHEVTDG